MTDTPHLAITLLEDGQAGAYATVNAALARLAALTQLSVIDRDLTAQPASPSAGDRYLIAATATGAAWAGHDDEIAYYLNGAWYFATPAAGWVMYVEDEDTLLVYDGTAWNTVV